MQLDGCLVVVTGQPDHILVEFMAQAAQFPERANEALRQFWTRHEEQMVFCASKWSYFNPTIDPEGIVNDVFLRVFQEAGKTVGEIRTLTLEEKDVRIVATVYNIVIEECKKANKRNRPKTLSLEEVREDLLSAWNTLSAPAEPEPDIKRQEESQLWRKWIGEIVQTLLTTSERAFLNACYDPLDPKGCRDNLCKQLGITRNTLRQKLSRIVEKVTIEALVREHLRVGPAEFTIESITKLCERSRIRKKKRSQLRRFVNNIAAELRKRANLN